MPVFSLAICLFSVSINDSSWVSLTLVSFFLENYWISALSSLSFRGFPDFYGPEVCAKPERTLIYILQMIAWLIITLKITQSLQTHGLFEVLTFFQQTFLDHPKSWFLRSFFHQPRSKEVLPSLQNFLCQEFSGNKKIHAMIIRQHSLIKR